MALVVLKILIKSAVSNRPQQV